MITQSLHSRQAAFSADTQFAAQGCPILLYRPTTQQTCARPAQPGRTERGGARGSRRARRRADDDARSRAQQSAQIVGMWQRLANSSPKRKRITCHAARGRKLGHQGGRSTRERGANQREGAQRPRPPASCVPWPRGGSSLPCVPPRVSQVDDQKNHLLAHVNRSRRQRHVAVASLVPFPATTPLRHAVPLPRYRHSMPAPLHTIVCPSPHSIPGTRPECARTRASGTGHKGLMCL